MARYLASYQPRQPHGPSWCPETTPELTEVRERIMEVQARTSGIQRLDKALESADIKLGSIAASRTTGITRLVCRWYTS